MKRWTITFHEAESALTGSVTKFGGQPSWLTEPTWPLSAATQKPMRFIGQIALDPSIVGQTAAQMAYLFMTDLMDEYVDGTWDPKEGENAIVLQPGLFKGDSAALLAGPTLYRMVKGSTPGLLDAEPCEFAVTLLEAEESDADEPDDSQSGNKIGGRPWFIQGPEYPDDERSWRLLVQIDATQVPFYVNFGDAGVGYAFLSDGGETAGFLWQCN